MENYKVKYETLLEAVNEIGSEPLKEIGEATKRLIVTPEKTVPAVTKEEFDGMKYRERVEFKNAHPEEYQTMVGGR